MYLAQRVRGSALAAHGVYHSLEYFKGVTGLRTSELLVCKKTETYVSTFSPLTSSQMKQISPKQQ